MCRHYLYRHIRLDSGEPFYIGIGTKPKRCSKTHEGEYSRAYNRSKSGRCNFWHNIVAKTDYEVEILLESDDYEFIKQKEIEFIALYGRRDLGKGTLVNLTDGGDGALGVIVSNEKRASISKSNTGKKVSDETRLKQRLIRLGIPWSEELRIAHEGTCRAGEDHHASRLTLNLETGIFYFTVGEAAEHNNLTLAALSNMLSGHRRNKTSIIYAEEDDSGIYPIIPEIKPYSPKIYTEEERRQMHLRALGRHIGAKSPKAKKVINTETGEIHLCLKELTKELGSSYNYYCRMLNPNIKKNNNTPFEYYNEEIHSHLIKNEANNQTIPQ